MGSFECYHGNCKVAYIKIYVFIIFYHERFHINCNVFVTIQYTSENLVYNRLLCIFWDMLAMHQSISMQHNKQKSFDEEAMHVMHELYTISIEIWF